MEFEEERGERKAPSDIYSQPGPGYTDVGPSAVRQKFFFLTSTVPIRLRSQYALAPYCHNSWMSMGDALNRRNWTTKPEGRLFWKGRVMSRTWHGHSTDTACRHTRSTAGTLDPLQALVDSFFTLGTGCRSVGSWWICLRQHPRWC